MIIDPTNTGFQIVKGASELFMRYGIRSVTLDEISKALSMSKKTIYQYFEDKDSLVKASVKMLIDKQRLDLIEISNNAKNVIEELMQTSTYMKEHVCNMNPSVLFDLKKYHPNAYELFVDFKKSFVENSIIENIEKGIKSGHFRSAINPKVVAKLRIEEIEMGFNPEIFSPEVFDFSKVQIDLFEHFIYGICTLKGHKLINEFKQINEED